MSHLPKTSIVVVEVGQELVGAARALDVQLGAASRARFVGMACMFIFDLTISKYIKIYPRHID